MLALTTDQLREFGRIPADEPDTLLQGFIDASLGQIERLTGQLRADLGSPESVLALKILALDAYQSRDFASQATSEAVMRRVNNLLAGDLKPEELIIYSATEAAEGG